MSLLNPLFWYLWLIPLTLVHECGHALAGRVLGFRVFWISLGYGRQIFEGRILGFNIRINAIPFGGVTVLASETSFRLRLRVWIAVFAGPATHLVLLGACLLILGSDFFCDRVLSFTVLDRSAPVEMFIYANAFLLLSNLLTKRAGDPIGLTYGDGHQLLRIPFLKEAEIQRYRIAYSSLEALEQMRSGRIQLAISIYEEALKENPQDYVLRHDLAIARLQHGEYASARQELIQMLESIEAREPERRILLLNNIAWADVVLGNDDLLAEADEYSEESMRFAPRVTSFIGTRGAVLVMTGRVQEGLNLLRTAFRQHSDRSDRASTACWIAIGAAHLGNPVESLKWLKRARKESPSHYLLNMSEQKVTTTLSLCNRVADEVTIK